MMVGYVWDLGFFEYWDVVGIEVGIVVVEVEGESVVVWVKEMVVVGYISFYKCEGGQLKYYNIVNKVYEVKFGMESFIILDNYCDQVLVFKNSEVIFYDIGDGVLNFEFVSFYNLIGEGVFRGMNEVIQIVEDGDWKGLVIGNNVINFSVGVNLMMIGMMVFQQEFDQLNMVVNFFQ